MYIQPLGVSRYWGCWARLSKWDSGDQRSLCVGTMRSFLTLPVSTGPSRTSEVFDTSSFDMPSLRTGTEDGRHEKDLLYCMEGKVIFAVQEAAASYVSFHQRLHRSLGPFSQPESTTYGSQSRKISFPRNIKVQVFSTAQNSLIRNSDGFHDSVSNSLLPSVNQREVHFEITLCYTTPVWQWWGGAEKTTFYSVNFLSVTSWILNCSLL